MWPRPVDCGHEAQGLKPAVILVVSSARLKSRPDTKLIFAVLLAWLKPSPDTKLILGACCGASELAP
jgi:hypothetical protein